MDALAKAQGGNVPGSVREAPQDRTLDFPRRRSLGVIAVRRWGSTSSEDWIYCGEARGRVRIPAGAESRLDVRHDAVAKVTAFRSLPRDALQGLNFRDLPLGDDCLSAICELGGLIGLDISGTRVTDRGAVHLSQLTDLCGLNLSRTAIGNVTLAHVGALKCLQWLNLSKTQVDDIGMGHLRALSHLRVLNLNCTTVSNSGLASLRGVSRLSHLALSETRITDQGLAQLAELHELTRLDLAETNISDASIGELARRSSLRYLDIWETFITREGETALQRALPGCAIAC